MWNKLKKTYKSTEGAAMVLAICIMAVTVALCLSIMAYGYRTYKSSLKDREGVQAKELVVSVSGMMRKQLEGEWPDSDDQTEIVAYLKAHDSFDYSFTIDGEVDSGGYSWYEQDFNDCVSVTFKKINDSSFKVITKAETEFGGYEITDSYKIEEEDDVWKISFIERT